MQYYAKNNKVFTTNIVLNQICILHKGIQNYKISSSVYN